MRHPGTRSMRHVTMLRPLLLGGILIVSVLMIPEVSAQAIRMESVTPAPATVSVTQSTMSSSRQAGDLPELVLTEEEWCPEIEDWCPISSYDFGTVTPGSSGPYLWLFLRNVSETVTATNLSIQSDAEFPIFPDFAHDCYSFDELPPIQGFGCRIRVKFAPSEPGPVAGMLRITTDEGVEVTLPLEGTGGSDRLLYGQFQNWDDWDEMPVFWGMFNAIYANSPAYNTELADDFLVEDPEGWTINQIGMQMLSQQFFPEVNSFDVFIMEDDGGIPGDVAVCSAPDSKAVLWEVPFDEKRIELGLSSPCHLPPGHYWLKIHVHADAISTSGVLGWGLQFLLGSEENPPPKPLIHLNPPAWRNPGGEVNIECTTWTSLYPPTCSLENSWPFSVAYGTIFWLIGDIGTVSNEETPNETVQRLTHPSPNPVRETASFTLTVDRAQQVTVEVFDMMGRRVQMLYEGSLSAGATETLRLDANTLSAGVYVIRALGEDFVDTHRVTVVH